MLHHLCTRCAAFVVPFATLHAQEFLFHNAKVWTGDPAAARAAVVLVQGERIRFVGDEASARALAGPGAEMR